MPKIRLDAHLLVLGLAPSKTRAQSLIMQGKVRVNGKPCTKAGTGIDATRDAVEVSQPEHPYVSRGGMKLAHAINCFQLDCEGVTALDVGASTGGFTDCLLQHGAAHVYAVDVGYGQLAEPLRQSPRVTNMERINGRTLTPESFPAEARPHVGVTDVSFISLKKILPALCGALNLEAPPVWVVALLKPQFECLDYFTPEEARAFDGVVRDEALRERVKAGVLEDLAGLLPAWALAGVAPSPIQGPKGNVEFLTLWLPHSGFSQNL